jgi:hypothetical protein
VSMSVKIPDDAKERALDFAITVARHANHYISPEGIVSMAKTFEDYLRSSDG